MVSIFSLMFCRIFGDFPQGVGYNRFFMICLARLQSTVITLLEMAALHQKSPGVLGHFSKGVGFFYYTNLPKNGSNWLLLSIYIYIHTCFQCVMNCGYPLGLWPSELPHLARAIQQVIQIVVVDLQEKHEKLCAVSLILPLQINSHQIWCWIKWTKKIERDGLKCQPVSLDVSMSQITIHLCFPGRNFCQTHLQEAQFHGGRRRSIGFGLELSSMPW